jgi:hypothetical protein
VRANAGRGQRFAQVHAIGAARSTRAGTVAAFVWLQPRAVRVGSTTARQSRLAAAQTARGVAWLAPRLASGARTAAATTARMTLTGAVLLARAVARTARELERATASAAEHGRASLEARRARRESEPPGD